MDQTLVAGGHGHHLSPLMRGLLSAMTEKTAPNFRPAPFPSCNLDDRGYSASSAPPLSAGAAIMASATSPFMHAALAATLALRGDEAGSAREAAEVRRLAPWLTQEQMEERLIGLSETGSEPQRLLRGLQLAFAQPKQQ